MQTVEALLAQGRVALADTETPSLDARLLLQHATGLSHAELIAYPERVVEVEVVARFAALTKRRAAFEPVSRILGAREFYGRRFRVTPAVLDPRADTEVLIDVCIAKLDRAQPQRFLDLGTGSGCIAVTLLAERPLATGVAVDVSEAALVVAQENAASLGVSPRVSFVEGHWFDAVDGGFDLIVSNPPYIETEIIAGLDVEVKDHDPHLALDGGVDGLDCYRAIAKGTGAHLNPGGHVIVEIGAGQAAGVTAIFAASGFVLAEQRHDLGGHVRVLAFIAAV
jgi:release factor glutamine methyltransferase